MVGRIVEVCQEHRSLSLEHGFLKVVTAEGETSRVDLETVAVLLVTARQATLSRALLCELAQRGIPTLLCGQRYSPQAIVFPAESHYRQSGILKAQINVSLPLKKNLWKEIIRRKITGQAQMLRSVGDEEGYTHLTAVSGHVKSGDSENREAYAARYYWRRLFGAAFRRNPDGDGLNLFLNYAYAVIRSSMARAVFATGLNPGLGIFHENSLNAFCLVDDLMEPFRPMADSVVLEAAGRFGIDGELTPEIKTVLIQCGWLKVKTVHGYSPLFQSMYYLASSYLRSLESGKSDLDIPEWGGCHEKITGGESL